MFSLHLKLQNQSVFEWRGSGGLVHHFVKPPQLFQPCYGPVFLGLRPKFQQQQKKKNGQEIVRTFLDWNLPSENYKSWPVIARIFRRYVQLFKSNRIGTVPVTFGFTRSKGPQYSGSLYSYYMKNIFYLKFCIFWLRKLKFMKHYRVLHLQNNANLVVSKVWGAVLLLPCAFEPD